MSPDDDESIERCKKNVKVFVRTLPLEKPCDSCAEISADRKTIFVRCLQDIQRDRLSTSPCPLYWAFRTDGIFHEASQNKVYRATARDLVDKVLDGVDCVLIGYGQTGSGKSFTLCGLGNNWEHRGIVPRFLSDMFAEKANRRKVNDIRYRLSFVELRGKDAIDLLTTPKRKIGSINVNDAFKNITSMDANDETETLRRLFAGEARRSFARGATYPASHLGATVITFHVSNRSLIKSRAVVATAKIHIVEMAGIGTVGKSTCSKPATDLGKANLMKMELEQYFSYLREPSAATYSVLRSSNLLKLLKKALTVTSVIRFVSHVRINKEDLDVTLSTMRLTVAIARLKPIKTTQCIRPQAEMIVRQLREEVNALKKELELYDMFLHQEAPMNISKSRVEQISRDAMSFLKDSISEFALLNVTQAQILMKIVKQLYNKLIAKEIEADKLNKAYEEVANALTRNSVTVNAADSPHRIRKGCETVAPYAPNDETMEKVGILDKYGITLGPIAETDEREGSAIKLKRSTNAPKTAAEHDGTIERAPEYAENVKDKFYQLQRMMTRTIEERQERGMRQ